MCPSQSVLQCYSPHLLSLYSLWITALLIGYLVGLGANAKRKSLGVPDQGHLWGVCFMQERPLLPILGALQTYKTLSVPDTPDYLGCLPVSPVTFLLCFWSFLLWKSLSRKATFECKCYFQSWKHTTHFRRLCRGMVLPRNEMNYLNKRMSCVKFYTKHF